MKKKSLFPSFFTLLLAAFFLAFTTSCDDDDDDKPTPPPPTEPAAPAFKVAFQHNVDGQPLVFNVQQFSNAMSQPYKVDKLMYFISNVRLINTTTGKTFAEPNSYHLINAASKNSFTINNLPEEAYDRIELAIGVDQAANASTDKKGDLDPAGADEMLWPWNTGYKFVLLEGYNNSRGLVYHIGGNRNYKTLSFPIQNPEQFQKDKVYTATFHVNVNELFKAPNQISFDSLSEVMNETLGLPLAENYADGMFTLKGVTK